MLEAAMAISHLTRQLRVPYGRRIAGRCLAESGGYPDASGAIGGDGTGGANAGFGVGGMQSICR